MVLQPAKFRLPPYLPLVDPDHFHGDLAFFRGLERLGYPAVLLGGTGGAKMRDTVKLLREHTNLRIVSHPSSPGEVCPVDLVLFPAVMNSNSHYTRPFGSGSLACALAIAELEVPYLPLAYFILGESTARWYADAFLIRSKKIIVGYCLYAKMMRYDHVLLDYEDPNIDIDPELISTVKIKTGVELLVSDEFTPDSARAAQAMGTDTIITPSNLYEGTGDPLALAAEFHAALFRR